jgi:arylsulfatase A-like enzyme
VRARRELARLANVGLVIFGCALLVVLGTGGTRLALPGVSIGLHRVWPPLQFFGLFAALRLLISGRRAGVEGAIVTFFARQGFPPRDTPARPAATVRTGALFGLGFGFIVAAVDVARVSLAAGHPGIGLSDFLALALIGGLLGIASGAAVGTLLGILVHAICRVLTLHPSRYDAGRWIVALFFVLIPGVLHVAPPAGEDVHLAPALLVLAALAILAGATVFFLLPAMALRASRGRWGLAIGASGVLALALGLLALGAYGVPGYAVQREDDSSYPNILLVSVSGLRADVLSAYREGFLLLPTLDSLAERGAHFESAWTTSTGLSPASASLLTGLYPSSHRVRAAGERLVFTGEGLPGVLGSHGFHTGGFVSSRALEGARTRFSELFQFYSDPTSLSDHVDRLALARICGLARDDAQDAPRGALQTVEAFRDWVMKLPSGPWFAWVQFGDPARPLPLTIPEGGRATESAAPPTTGPLPRPPAWASEADRQRPAEDWVRGYFQSLRQVDAAIGGMLQVLAARGELARTLIFVVGDSGLMLLDGEAARQGAGDLAEHSLHVPWIVVGPGIAADSIPGPCSLVDVFPTILGLVGMTGERSTQGEDLSRYLVDHRGVPRPPHSGPVFAETASNSARTRERVVRLGSWKLLRSADGRERLFIIGDGQEGEITQPRGRQERLRQQLSDILSRQRSRDPRS